MTIHLIVCGIDGGGLDDLLGFAAIGREKGTRKWLHYGRAWAYTGAIDFRRANAPVGALPHWYLSRLGPLQDGVVWCAASTTHKAANPRGCRPVLTGPSAKRKAPFAEKRTGQVLQSWKMAAPQPPIRIVSPGCGWEQIADFDLMGVSLT